MEEKGVIAIILSIVFILAIAIFFAAKNLSNSSAELEKCNTIKFNGEGKTNVVFFSSKENAEKSINNFFEISPFDKNKENFNFYSIDYNPECELYQGIAVLCYSKELVKKAGSCPNDYIVVLDDQPNSIRSSTYMNVISLNSKNHPNVFAHEFGHAFANLADEYVPAKIPKGSKNCAGSCDDFNNLGECMKGCSDDSHYRSINQGLMRTLSVNTFGQFNEEIISSNIKKTAGITGNAIQNSRDCKNEQYYLIEGALEGGDIKITSKTIESGCVGGNGVGPFSYNLVLENNQPAVSEDFNPELIFTDEVNETQISGGPRDYSGEFLLKVPIVDKSSKLEIINEKKKTEINLRDIGSRPCAI
jgi:hypothetical protein